MLRIFFIINTICLLLFSCNYRELGCLVCKSKKRVEVKKYSNNKIEEIQSIKYKSMRMVDVPVRSVTKLIRYDSLGNTLERTKIIKIDNVWKRSPTYLKRLSRIDSLNGKYTVIEKYFEKDSKLILDYRKIKKN